MKHHALVNTLIGLQISKSNVVSHQTDQANLDMSPLLIRDHLFETAKGYSISNSILYMKRGVVFHKILANNYVHAWLSSQVAFVTDFLAYIHIIYYDICCDRVLEFVTQNPYEHDLCSLRASTFVFVLLCLHPKQVKYLFLE